MARGERRSLITLEFGPGGSELEDRVQAEAASCAGAVERLFGKRAPAPWFHLPFAVRDADLEQLQVLTAELRANSDAILILGSPGLEIGARALLRALGPALPGAGPRLEFILADWSSAGRLADLLEWLEDRRVCLVVLSGPDAGPAMSACLRILRRHVLWRHGPAEATRRIVLACSGGEGPLHTGARRDGLRILETGTPVAEPYSAFTPAGLLPAALGGVDPVRLVEGARSQARSLEGQELASLPAVRYALARILLAEDGRAMELLGAGGPPYSAILDEWGRVLALPASGLRRAPLPVAWRPSEAHALREPWLATAPETAFGTWIVAPPRPGPTIPGEDLGDGWNGLAEVPYSVLEERQAEAEQAAWTEAGLPTLALRVPRLDGMHLGALLHFFHCVRGLSAVWHAPEADMKKVAPSQRLRAEGGTLALEPAIRAASGAV